MTLVLSQNEVRSLLPMPHCIELAEQALVALSKGHGQNPLRRGVRSKDGSGRLLGLMPGEAPGGTLGVKAVTVTPANHGGPWDAHQGVVLLFARGDGRPTALFDASEITALRTAAASAVATRALARPESRTLALIGSGVQARTHLEAMASVLDLQEVRVYSRSSTAREAFAQGASARHGLTVRAVSSAREAVTAADVICTVTSAHEPVFDGAWLSPGTHINAAGACMPKARELDTETVRRSRFFTDCLESAENEAGDWLLPLAAGEVAPEHLLGEVGQVLLGELPGRQSPDEVTVFESLGIALEDLVVAEDLLTRARALGVGTEVDLGGSADAGWD